jgi:hypothetical protein
MVLEFKFGTQEPPMKVAGKKIKLTDSEEWFGTMVIITKENGLMIRQMEGVDFNI